ncbi:mucin-2-like [Paramacrobiotus metropolitanus]|uniref:mucin-2-like n=1 Tax=Paramacrobiotus metropolitanus TaxID=2943436 RepID=UPI0024461347|nr:mucin-2-like [Paramacrobiotus metropolitanus]
MANTILCTVLLIEAIVSVELHFSMGATRAPPLTAAPYTMINPINPTNPPVTTTPAPAPAPVASTTGKPTTAAGTTTGTTPRYQTMEVVVITPAHTTTAKTTTTANVTTAAAVTTTTEALENTKITCGVLGGMGFGPITLGSDTVCALYCIVHYCRSGGHCVDGVCKCRKDPISCGVYSCDGCK